MIRQITKDELKLLIHARDHLKIVDVLSHEHYLETHLPGAISLPLAILEERAEILLSKDDLIVVYCADYHCPASTQAAEKLLRLGFKHVLDYKGGLADYRSGCLPPCEHTVTAEQERFLYKDEPCDDSTGK
jgi:rhodanese-related sulfurtransferase